MKKIIAISSVSIALSLLIVVIKSGIVNLLMGNCYPENTIFSISPLIIVFSLVFLVWGVLLLYMWLIEGEQNYKWLPYSLFEQYYKELGFLLFAVLIFVIAVFMPVQTQTRVSKENDCCITANTLANIIEKQQGSQKKDTLFFENDSLNLHIIGLTGLEKSIKELTEVLDSEEEGSENTISFWYYIFVVIIIGLMVYVAKIPSINSRTKTISAILASLAGFVSISAITIESFSIDIDSLFCFKKPELASSIEYEQNVINPDTLFIYPFYSGSIQLADSTVDSLNSFLVNVESKKERITNIYLSGSFDKRELNDSLVKIYGSNVGLALARVNAVKAIIRKHHFLDSVLIIPFVKGPEIYDTIMTDKSLEKDRSVFVVVEYLEEIKKIEK